MRLPLWIRKRQTILTGGGPTGWDRQSIQTVRTGILVYLREELWQDKKKDLGANATDEEVEKKVDEYIASTTGKKQINRDLEQRYRDFEFNAMVAAFRVASPAWKAIVVNLISAAIGAFAGPWILDFFFATFSR